MLAYLTMGNCRTIDLPERLGCPASGRNRQYPSEQSISVRDVVYPLPEISTGPCLFGVDGVDEVDW